MTDPIRMILTRNITAEDVAVVGDIEDGYKSDDIIGREGTEVTVIDPAEDEDWVEVTDFSEDPYVEAWVPRIALDKLG